jgi:predicted dehydrogenase
VTLRVGVVGTGMMGADHIRRLSTVLSGTRVAAVSDVDTEQAKRVAEAAGGARVHSDGHDLIRDDEVDAVLIASPGFTHAEYTLACIEAGKPVLCEKPLALNARQARRMVDAAQAHGVFLMEAVWSRFLPAYRAVADLVSSGRIGEPLVVEADFGFRRPATLEHRLFDPHLGGGALLDLGIYPLQLCSLTFGGAPDRVVADGVIGETGVDEVVAAVLHHPGGGIGVVKAAIRVALSCQARISGSDGWIDLPARMHCPDWIDVHTADGDERIETGFEGDGLRFQVDEVHRCLAEVLTESPIMPLDETLAIATTLDSIRAQLGVVYPGE